jgi:Flp pilus assembly protein TadG
MRVPSLTNFQNNQRGSVAIIFALLVTTLFGFLALSVDIARAYRAQSRIANALDAAALAGAKGLDSGKTDEEILASARAFFNQGMNEKENAVTTSNFQIVVDRWNDTVTVKTDARLRTAFGGVIGRSDIALDGLTMVKYRIRRVELALSLDVTGSMNYDVADSSNRNYGKLEAMKKAAKEVTKVMFDEAMTDDRVRVSLVPWSTAVNAGSFAATVSQNSSIDNCVIERLGANAASDTAPYGPDASRTFTSPPSGYTCPTSPIVPLLGRNRSTDLNTAIDALTGNGGTAGHIGTAWGWYSIAPAWSGIWPVESRPRDYNPSEVIKSILIMSDGEFNVSWKTETDWYSNQATMLEESYAQFQALCSAMKTKRVVIYTVGFGLTNPRAIDEMRNCATSNSSFFQATSDTELTDAFKRVAEDLKQMRLTR